MVSVFGRGLIVATCALSLAASASAFNVTIDPNTVTQCGPTHFNWAGGTAPFSISCISSYSRPFIVEVPEEATQTVDGESVTTFDWNLPFPYGAEVIFYVNDATGNATGLSSKQFKVGDPQPGASCTVGKEGPDFFFYIAPDNMTIPQCSSVNLSFGLTGDQIIAPPLTIWGVLPEGDVFKVQTHGSDMWTIWNANIEPGQTFVMTAFDALGRMGGTTRTQTIIASGNSSCMSSTSPMSPAHSGGAFVANYTSGSDFDSPQTETSGLSKTAIVGIGVGAVVGGLLLLGGLLYFCCRRDIAAVMDNRRKRKMRQAGDIDLQDETPGSDRFLVETDYSAPPISPYVTNHHLGSMQSFDRSTAMSTPSDAQRVMYLGQNSGFDGSSVGGSSVSASRTASGRPTKASLVMPNNPPSGLLLHQDAGRLEREDDPELHSAVEELPPTYNPEWDDTETNTSGRLSLDTATKRSHHAL